MKVVAGLILLLAHVPLSHSCYGEEQVYLCLSMPSAFEPGYSFLVLILRDVGEINATVLRSSNLSSVTKLRMESAGVTKIAEGAFSSLQNLKNVSLKQNLLTQINPNWFGRPEILSELILTGNRIEAVSGFMLSGLRGLTKLVLSDNMITTIDLNGFSSQTVLAELDLSGNRMTSLSPQVFRSLRSTTIRLDGNPWDCSCEAQDFIYFVKDLHSRFLLDRAAEVTCESPVSLRGKPLWNVSVCVTSPPPGPPSVTPAVQLKPTDTITAVPQSTVVTTPPARPASEIKPSVQPKPTGIITTTPQSTVAPTPSTRPTKTETSVRPKPTDASLITSSHTAASPAQPSETKPSVQPKPTDILTTIMTPPLQTESSPPSVTEISLHPKPSNLPTYAAPAPTGITESTSRPTSDTNIVSTLVAVIVVLSLLLFLVCFLVVLHRRKRHNKTVMPGSQEGNKNEPNKGDGSCKTGHAQVSGDSEKGENNQWGEMGWKRSFTGVRAKSANAILFTAPFCAPVKDQGTLQTKTDTQIKVEEDQAEGKQKLGSESGVDGRLETEDLTNKNDASAKNNENLDRDPDAVPYLSIGKNENHPNDFKNQSSDGSGQSSQMRKVMGRISTWPPTAAQWQARCTVKEKEEVEGSGVFTVWAPKSAGDVKKVPNMDKHLCVANQIEGSIKINDARMEMGESQSQEPNKTPHFTEAHFCHTGANQEEEMMNLDPDTVTQTTSETLDLNREKIQNQDLKPAENPPETSSNKADPKRAVKSRQKSENKIDASKASSGGASPDDETLLSGNEYAFMDLLHEVVQNNGRWTRERWRQTHTNKQQR